MALSQRVDSLQVVNLVVLMVADSVRSILMYQVGDLLLMSKIVDPLRTTDQDLHRIIVSLHTTEEWYAIMRECRENFGKNWHTQPKMRKKLVSLERISAVVKRHIFHLPGLMHQYNPPSLNAWFDVPDPNFATYIALKYGLDVTYAPKPSGK